MEGGGRKVAVIREVAAWAAMVVVEGCIIGLTIMANSAMAKGISPFVFVVYVNALGSLILLPFSFQIFHKNRSEEGSAVLRWAFVERVFVLGLIGVCIAQNLAFVGLSYSSPIVACGMANQIPAFTFILGILLGTTRFEWSRSSSQARLIGSLVSLMGAICITFYKGPAVRTTHHSLSLSLSRPPLLIFSSPNQTNWVLGCTLLAASSFTLVIWNFVQVGTVKLCPQVMKIVSFYTLFGTIQSAAVGVFLERDPTAWKLGLNFQLLVIVLTAIFSSLIRSNVQLWCSKVKGPHFVAIFKPVGIPYASTFGCLLFSDTFHYGSMLGAFICGIGYYTVLWGQIKDEETSKLGHGSKSCSSSNDDLKKVPLLQEAFDQV
ncbi:WAT1-related protein At1g70260-like [Andrographis paniculata]|uniref:WAT1-related protein At1g70260-like n=1 Tax=Andrographis paniculata TaxID=175694 RepID=UPI0021E780AC|nr:WAT1-related protein At1g70260-like [Andrographis paniculata]